MDDHDMIDPMDYLESAFYDDLSYEEYEKYDYRDLVDWLPEHDEDEYE